MALAKRAQGDIGSDYGYTHRVSIWQEGYVGSVDTLTFVGQGFVHKYHPSINDIVSSLVPSTMELFIENDSSAIDTLLSDILSVQQTDFYIQVERSTGASYTHYWFGQLLQDQFSVPEQSKPYAVRLSATDGLSKLRSVEYDFANTVSATTNNPEHTPVLNIIQKCLQQAVDDSLYGASDIYLVTAVDWWETGQTYSATADPLADLVIDVAGFRIISLKNGAELFNGYYGPATLEIEYLTCWEVLEELAKIFCARVYQFNGAWYFEQVPLREASTTKRMRYTKSIGTPTYSKPNTYTTLDGTLRKARLYLNQTNYFPALKKVTVEQQAFGSTYSPLLIFIADNLSNTTTQAFGLFSDEYYTSSAGTQVSQQFYLQIQFLNRFAYDAANDTTSWYQYGNKYELRLRCKIDVEIKLSDAYSSDVYYWDGVQWDTSAAVATIYSHTTILSIGGGKRADTFNTQIPNFGTRVINTTYIPCTGTLEITVDNLGFQNYHGNPNTGPYQWSNISSGDISNLKGGIYFTLKTFLERGDSAFLYAVSNPNTDIGDNEIYNYPTLKIADKTIQSGHLLFDNGSSIEACEEWEVATDANNLPLPALLVQQRLALQSELIPIYEGRVRFPEGYGEGIAFDSQFWLPHEYTFYAMSGEVEGSWYKVGMYASLGNPNEDQSGLTSDSSFAARGASAIDLEIDDIQSRTRAIGYDPDDNALIITSRERSYSGIVRKTDTIDASAAGSSTLQTTQHKIFITWTGGDGTYTLSLPAVETGVEFVIITDSTITASRDIAVTPDGSDTINGSAELTLTGAGRVTIEAANGEWHGY